MYTDLKHIFSSVLEQTRSETAWDLPELVIAMSTAPVSLDSTQGIAPFAGLDRIEVVIHIHLVSCCHLK
jgi:hypothetical protein